MFLETKVYAMLTITQYFKSHQWQSLSSIHSSTSRVKFSQITIMDVIIHNGSAAHLKEDVQTIAITSLP